MWFSLLASVALKSAAVLGVAWLIAILLRRRSAARRHLVWTSAFAALLALPLLSLSLPSVLVPVSSSAAAARGGLRHDGFNITCEAGFEQRASHH